MLSLPLQGWIQYSAEQVRKLTAEAVATGLQFIKIKVGSDVESDIERLTAVREVIGPDRTLMVDANQKWGVKQAIEWMERLAVFKPWWIEVRHQPPRAIHHHHHPPSQLLPSPSPCSAPCRPSLAGAHIA